MDNLDHAQMEFTENFLQKILFPKRSFYSFLKNYSVVLMKMREKEREKIILKNC